MPVVIGPLLDAAVLLLLDGAVPALMYVKVVRASDDFFDQAQLSLRESPLYVGNVLLVELSLAEEVRLLLQVAVNADVLRGDVAGDSKLQRAMSARLEGGASRVCGAADAPSGDATGDSHLQPHESVLLEVAPAVPELVAPEVDMLVVPGLPLDAELPLLGGAVPASRYVEVVRAYDGYFDQTQLSFKESQLYVGNVLLEVSLAEVRLLLQVAVAADVLRGNVAGDSQLAAARDVGAARGRRSARVLCCRCAQRRRYQRLASAAPRVGAARGRARRTRTRGARGRHAGRARAPARRRGAAAARRRRARLRVRHVVRASDNFFIAIDDLETDQIDAIKAITQADADCKLFAEMPQGFAVAGLVLELNKALEGIKQGAHLWFNLNRRVLLKIGFESSVSEPNLYRLMGQPIIVGVFADDILSGFHRLAIEVYKNIKRAYSKEIRIGDIAIKPAEVFIGVQLRRDHHFETITLTQESYIEATFERYKMEARECATPYGWREETERFDKMVKAPEESCIDRIMYLKLCGALVWPACMTRPDIQYAVGFLCTFSASPGATHYAALLNVLGYLHKTKHLGLTYGDRMRVPHGLSSMPEHFCESHGLHAYHDSSFGKEVYPWGGYAVFITNAAVA